MNKFFHECFHIMLELSPWLLLGTVVSGALHSLLPQGFIRKRLGGRGFSQIFRASILGVPLPLCSCGVIPAAVGLRKDGASNGASFSFLISTPQTGVDSVLVSASFLGLPFAVFKVLSAFVMGILGGALIEMSEPGEEKAEEEIVLKRIQKEKAFYFMVNELLRGIYLWILLGVLVAGFISTVIPPDYFTRYEWMQGAGGLLIMLLISVPLYVCATSSVPIAASLIAAGLPHGSALVFLMAGPATNVATLGAVYKEFGVKNCLIYLGTVVLGSMSAGFIFDSVLESEVRTAGVVGHVFPMTLSWISFLILSSLFIYFIFCDVFEYLRNRKRAGGSIGEICSFTVEGLTCQNCVRKVTGELRNLEGVEDAQLEITGELKISGAYNREEVEKLIEELGYVILSREGSEKVSRND